MADVEAVILAAGRSERMGENKLLLPLAGKPLLAHLLDQIPFTSFTKVIGVFSDERVAELFHNYEIIPCRNTTPLRGKSFSIQLALEQSCGADGIMFFVADQPLLKQPTIIKLLRSFARNPHRIIVPYSHGQPANPVIFPRRFTRLLSDLQNDSGGRAIIRSNGKHVEKVDMATHEDFIDIDTPEEYRELWDSQIHRN